LQVLSLGHTQVTDAGMKSLEGLKDLRDLEVPRSGTPARTTRRADRLETLT